MSLVLNARGEPEIPNDIKRRLKALDDGFSIAIINGCWWLMQRWRENDPKWAWVQDGRIPESQAYDGIGAFPMDCGFEQMPAFIEKSLREFPVRDLTRQASAFAHGESLAPEAEEIKHDMFEEAIKDAESTGHVTGRRIKHGKDGKFTKKGE
jgi:hypothetical protein